MQALFFLGIILVILLGVLIILFFARQENKKVLEDSDKENTEIKVGFNTLVDTIKDKNTSSKKLQETLDMILQEHGEIKDFKVYQDILLRITHHPHTNKNIIISFDKGLSKRNPRYKKEISNTVTDGLNTRK